MSVAPWREPSFEPRDYEHREITGDSDAHHTYDYDRRRVAHVALPCQTSKSVVPRNHLRGDHYIPSDRHAERHANADCRQHGRQDDAAKNPRLAGAERSGKPDVLAPDCAHAIENVNRNNEKCADECDEHD